MITPRALQRLPHVAKMKANTMACDIDYIPLGSTKNPAKLLILLNTVTPHGVADRSICVNDLGGRLPHELSGLSFPFPQT